MSTPAYGKGDSNRTTDRKTFAENFDRIFGKRKQTRKRKTGYTFPRPRAVR